MSAGCICCTVRGDLIRVIGRLMRRRERLEYALLETTGLADPAQVVQTLLAGDELKGQLELDAVVTAVDALHVALHLDQSCECAEQIAFADVVLLDLGSRTRSGDVVTEEVMAHPWRYHEMREGLRVKEVIAGDGAQRRRYVVCQSAAEETRQRQRRAKLLEGLEAELDSLRPGEDGSHSKAACALLASGRYGRYLRETAGGKLRIDRAAIADAERYDGKWIITSNDETLTLEDLALGYRQPMRVEACWRQLKHGLRSKSLFRPCRGQDHLMVSVLALLLERVAEISASDTWRNVAAAIHQIEVVDCDRAEARVIRTSHAGEETTALLGVIGATDHEAGLIEPAQADGPNPLPRAVKSTA